MTRTTTQNTRWGPCPHCRATGWTSAGATENPLFHHDRPQGGRCIKALRDEKDGKIAAKFPGVNVHRLKDNELEMAFAKAWGLINVKPSGLATTTLGYLLNEKGDQRYPVEPSARDWKVANTLMQWLGSPVGQNFLLDTILMHQPLIDELLRRLHERKDH